MRLLEKKPKKTKKPKRVSKRPTRPKQEVVITIKNEFDKKPLSRGLFKSKPYQERQNSGFSFGSSGPHFSTVSSPFQPPQSALKCELKNLGQTILETNIKQEKQTNSLEKQIKEAVDTAYMVDNREKEIQYITKPRAKRRTAFQMMEARSKQQARRESLPNSDTERADFEKEISGRNSVGNGPSFSNAELSGLGPIGLGGFNSSKISASTRFAPTPVSKKKHSVSSLVTSSIEQTAERPLTEPFGGLGETGIMASESQSTEPSTVDVVEEGKGQLGGIDALEPPLITSAYKSTETPEEYMAREGFAVSSSPRSPRPPSVKVIKVKKPPPPPPAGNPKAAEVPAAMLENFSTHGNDMGFNDEEQQYEPSEPSPFSGSGRYG